MFRHLCSKNKAFLPCLSGQVLDFSIFYTHKYKIFLLITFFKIFRNDWAHTGNIYCNFAIKCQWAQSFLNILKKVINKKILYLCVENMLKSSFYSVAFNFFGPCLLHMNPALCGQFFIYTNTYVSPHLLSIYNPALCGACFSPPIYRKVRGLSIIH